MAKKTKDETIDLLYIKEVPNDKKKTKKAKKSTKNKVPKRKPKENDIINLDDELIIGLTPKPEQRKPKKENKNNLQSKKQKSTIKNNSNRCRGRRPRRPETN